MKMAEAQEILFELGCEAGVLKKMEFRPTDDLYEANLFRKDKVIFYLRADQFSNVVVTLGKISTSNIPATSAKVWKKLAQLKKRLPTQKTLLSALKEDFETLISML